MALVTSDWIAIGVLGAGALMGTLGRRVVRVCGFVIMLVAVVGWWLAPFPKADAPSPIVNNAPSINTLNQSGGNNTINVGPNRLTFNPATADQLIGKLPPGKTIDVVAVGSAADWEVASQYADYLKTKGFEVTLSRMGMLVPPPDQKIRIGDVSDPRVGVIIAPSAF
jgi:hypothetical protein